MPPSNYERLPQENEEPLVPNHPLSLDHIRPATYYGDGPFDPPSSDDEEDESLLEKSGPSSPGLGRAESGRMSRGHVPEKKRPNSLRFMVTLLVSLVLLSAVVGIIAASTYTGTTYHAPGVRKITMDHVFNGTFSAVKQSLRWVPEAGDGVFSISQDGYIKLVDLKTNTTSNLVAVKDIKDERGWQIFWSDWQISPDMKYILIKTDNRKQWRHSSFGNYYVHNIEDKTTYPIIPPTNPSRTAYATWSPTGQSIAYVIDNDLYILTSPSSEEEPIRITTSGNASLFHGVPDWVYEEEIFSANFALWWSPDSTKLAFLAFDETAVDEFTFPVYNPTENSNAVIPYTSDVVMKYPKPGYNNPLVSVHVFDLKSYLADEEAALGFPAPNATLELDWEKRHPVENSIIMEVAWVGNDALMLKEVTRNSDDGNVVLFDLDSSKAATRAQGRVVRTLGKNGEQGDSGWIDHAQSIYPLPGGLSDGSDAYLDIVPTPEGYNHIALFSPVDSGTPRFLTSGEWEVSGNIMGVDPKNSVVYFEAASPSIERHIFSAPIDVSSETAEPTALTDTSKPSYYSSSFSPEAGFYLLSYEGPNVPWQRVMQVNNSDFDFVVSDNERLVNITMDFEAPIVLHSTLESEGYEFNVKEIRPPRMDDSGRTKYPVLFHVYGGPQSQTVDLKFKRDWHEYLACGMQYVVVIVDGRGTGFKGRKLRNPVKDNLGFWETVDQINAAKIWAAKDYVDPGRIGIWGWSYGGFMSSKVVEANAGIHSLAMAVAPVTSWRLYDSIYTERYMNLPDLNPGGYVNASVSNVTGFHEVDFLLAHGSADDNVHYANSAHLLDMFTTAHVRNFRFRMFTDSDHSITRRGAYREIYEYLTGFLQEKWGAGGRRRGW